MLPAFAHPFSLPQPFPARLTPSCRPTPSQRTPARTTLVSKATFPEPQTPPPPLPTNMSAAIAASLASGGVESVDFLNDIIAQLWDYINVAGSKLTKEVVEPMFAENLPGPLASLHFTKINLGTKPIRFDRIDVHSRKEGIIKLDVDVLWDGECDIELKAPIVGRVGVRKLKLGGRMSILLVPLIDRLPLVTAAQIGFVNPPAFDLDFTGAADIADFSLISKTIDKIINDIIASLFVLPNRMLVKIDPANVWYDTYQNPLGFIRMTFVNGSGFVMPEGWFKDIPDIFLKVNFSAEKQWRTKTINNSVEPEWDETVDFLLSDHDQTITIEAMDDDLASDDKLGRGRITVGKLLTQDKEASVPLLVHNVDTGAVVQVKCEVLQFVRNLASLRSPDNESRHLKCGLLTILVAGVKNLPGEREEAGSQVVVEAFEKKFNTPIVPDMPGTDALNPLYDAAFRVMLTRKMVDEGSEIELTLKNSGKKLGSTSVTFEEVCEAEGGVVTGEYELGNGAVIMARFIVRGIEVVE